MEALKMNKTGFRAMNTSSLMEPLIPSPDPFDFPPSLDDRRENDGPFESTLYEALHGGGSTGCLHQIPSEITYHLDRNKTISVDAVSKCSYTVPESHPLRKSLSAQDVRSPNIVMKYLFSAKFLKTPDPATGGCSDSVPPESETDERTKRLNEAVVLTLKALISDEPIEIEFDDWEYLEDEPSPNISLDYLTLSEEEGDEDSVFGLPKLKTCRHRLSDSVSEDAVTRYKAHRTSLRRDEESIDESRTLAVDHESSFESDDCVNNTTYEKTDAQPEAPVIGVNVKISLPTTSQDFRIKKNIAPANVKKGPVKALVPVEQVSKLVNPAETRAIKTSVPHVLDKSTDSSFSGSLLASSTPVKDAVPKPSMVRPRNSFLNPPAKRSKSVSSPRISKLPSTRTQGTFKSGLKRPSSAPNVAEREALTTLTNTSVKGTPKAELKRLVGPPRPSFRGKENLLANRSRAH